MFQTQLGLYIVRQRQMSIDKGCRCEELHLIRVNQLHKAIRSPSPWYTGATETIQQRGRVDKQPTLIQHRLPLPCPHTQ